MWKHAAKLLTMICAALLCVSCGSKITDNNQAGNASGVGNPTLAGVLFNSDGTPASNVVIHLRKKSISDNSYGIKDTATDKTDNNGQYYIVSDTGSFVLDCTDGNNNATLIDSVFVSDTSDTNILNNDTLRPAGAIRGIIRLAEGGDPRKVLVQAFDIDRSAAVDNMGNFLLKKLARGTYSLRLTSSLDNYGIVDTMNIVVHAGDTTLLDTITMPFLGIPVPKGVKSTYDTLSQAVTISWNKSSEALVKCYIVERRNVDSNTVYAHLTNQQITDTIYVDSTAEQGKTYDYKIVAVDWGDNQGSLSDYTRKTIIGAYSLVDSISCRKKGDTLTSFNDMYADMITDNTGNYYMSTYRESANDSLYLFCEKYDSTGQYLWKYQYPRFSNDYIPPLLTRVTEKTLWSVQPGCSTIVKFSADGTTLGKDTLSCAPSSILLKSTVLYAATIQGINQYDSSCNFQQRISSSFAGGARMAQNNAGNMYAVSYGGTVYSIASTGTIKQLYIQRDPTLSIHQLVFHSDNVVLMMWYNQSYTQIHIINTQTSKRLGTFRINSFISKIIPGTVAGTFRALTQNGTIYSFKLRVALP